MRTQYMHETYMQIIVITDNRNLKHAKIQVSPNNRSVRFIPVINDFTKTRLHSYAYKKQ